jgi:hypothetical protein
LTAGPLILRLSARSYFDLAGVSESPYLWHWLEITVGLFALSALTYIGRTVVALRRREP